MTPSTEPTTGGPRGPGMEWIPSMNTIARTGLLSISGLLTLTGLGLYNFQTKLIYPSNIPQGSREVVDKPSKYGMEDFEDLTLTTPDGLKIRAYLIPQPDETERPTLLFCHANAGNMGHRLPIARVFHRDMRFNVLMLSYRGYGLSEGVANEVGMRIDAQAALDYILAHPKLGKTRVVLYGQSIGGAVAIDLAGKNQERLSGLIVENTFLSLPKLVPEVMPVVKPFVFLLNQYWVSESVVPRLRLPVLFLSGSRDEMIPPAHMQQLFDLCGSHDKDIKHFPNGTHNDTCISPGYFEAIAVFLRDQVLHRPKRSTTFDPTKMAGDSDELRQQGAEAGSRVPHL